MDDEKLVTEWDYVLALTKEELHSVTIINDNADFIGPDSAIIFGIGLDKKFGGQGVTYYGDSRLDCLKKAYTDFKLHLSNQ